MAAVGDHLTGGHHHRLPRVDPHRVDILHVADDDGRIRPVPHHLVLEFDPAVDGFGYQHLAVPGEREPLLDTPGQRLAVGDDAGARPAERVGGPHDNGQPADPLERLLDFRSGADRDRPGNRLPEGRHALAELLAVLGGVDGLEWGAHDIDIVLLQDATLREVGGHVEPGLATEPRDDPVRILPRDDLGDGLGGDRLDVDCIRHLRIGHDRRGVRVHQDDADALLLERSAGLGPGVIELGCLSDADGAAADEEDGAVVVHATRPESRHRNKDGDFLQYSK